MVGLCALLSLVSSLKAIANGDLSDIDVEEIGDAVMKKIAQITQMPTQIMVVLSIQVIITLAIQMGLKLMKTTMVLMILVTLAMVTTTLVVKLVAAPMHLIPTKQLG